MIFTNHYLKSKIILTFAAILMCCIYCGRYGTRHFLTMEKALAEPVKYKNAPMRCQLCIIKKVSGNKLEFYQKKKAFRAQLKNGVFIPDCKVKRQISMTGTVVDSVLYIDSYHVHANRGYKVIISLIALIGLLVYIGPRLFRLMRNPFASGREGAEHA
ncbi:MAG: hypothetical protein PHC61_13265 [Chitinivibrionales bacterium]|nr:hypothetical protein [Chitinivibrionales bacterium]